MLKRMRGRLRRGYLRLRAGVRLRKQRHALLMHLPKGAVGAEVGAWRGDHAASILRWARPSRLFLVDPWQHHEGEGYEDAAYGGKADGGQTEMDRIYQSVLDRFAGRIRIGQVVVYREPSVDAARKLGD